MSPREMNGGDRAQTSVVKTEEADATTNRPKRVRTGCLTCRERHLKCDEGWPVCRNCQKSSRPCRRGVRLNFIDTHVRSPPVVPTSHEWNIHFQDESRDIASEYKGGLSRYAPVASRSPSNGNVNGNGNGGGDGSLDFGGASVTQSSPGSQPSQRSHSQSQSQPQPQQQHQLPPIQLPSSFPEHSQMSLLGSQRDSFMSQPNGDTNYNIPQLSASMYSSNSEPGLQPADESRDYLSSPEEVLFMQVFVEEVGLWMDSMDPNKHFSRILPFHSLNQPMLLNAFLACGARHLTLVNPRYNEDKALNYYDTATTELLRTLQNPDRDTVICATTAVILNVYEVMSERALQRMYHIAGARALIKECGWNARSTGIGAACFWLNVGMELLSCLRFNWQVAWDPDDWGLDMNMARETESGREDIWTYRMIYITAKVANFRASSPRYQGIDPRDEQIRLQNRVNEWKRLREWCDLWNENIPRTMHPIAYIDPAQTSSKSAFPEVWLIKRTTIVARLFYHTTMCLLSQSYPVMSPTGSEELHNMRWSHSHQICGLVAHVKDRGVASVALRSLAIAAECLTARHEQEEVLQIFDKIRKETGWRVGFLNQELKKKWGWSQDETLHQTPQSSQRQSFASATPISSTFTTQFPPPQTAAPPAPAPPPAQAPSLQTSPQTNLPPGSAAPPPQRRMITNPLITADFSSQNPPYSAYYVAPASHHQQHQQQQQHQHNHYNF